MTSREWPSTDSERTAAVLERLAEVLRSDGERFLTLAADYQRTRMPTYTESGPRSREDAADAKRERQLARDCEQAREGLRLVQDIAADYLERVLRVVTVSEDLPICPRCGRRLDPKREKVKWWESREPLHPSCYQAWLRQKHGEAS